MASRALHDQVFAYHSSLFHLPICLTCILSFQSPNSSPLPRTSHIVLCELKNSSCLLNAEPLSLNFPLLPCSWLDKLIYSSVFHLSLVSSDNSSLLFTSKCCSMLYVVCCSLSSNYLRVPIPSVLITTCNCIYIGMSLVVQWLRICLPMQAICRSNPWSRN